MFTHVLVHLAAKPLSLGTTSPFEAHTVVSFSKMATTVGVRDVPLGPAVDATMCEQTCEVLVISPLITRHLAHLVEDLLLSRPSHGTVSLGKVTSSLTSD